MSSRTVWVVHTDTQDPVELVADPDHNARVCDTQDEAQAMALTLDGAYDWLITAVYIGTDTGAQQ